jgi:lysophospholipase L1-like esterase
LCTARAHAQEAVNAALRDPGIFASLQPELHAASRLRLVDLQNSTGLCSAQRPGDCCGDGIHPTPPGYARLAAAWAQAVEPAVAALAKVKAV